MKFHAIASLAVLALGLHCASTVSGADEGADAADAPSIRDTGVDREVAVTCPAEANEGAACSLPEGTTCRPIEACVSCGLGLFTRATAGCSCRSGAWVCDIDADCFGPGPGVFADRACSVPVAIDGGSRDL